MTRSEQETGFRWAADEDVVSVWSAQPAVKRKLEKRGYQPYKVSRQQGREVVWFYKIPLAEFRWRVAVKRTGARNTSPASLAALKKNRGGGFRKAV